MGALHSIVVVQATPFRGRRRGKKFFERRSCRSKTPRFPYALWEHVPLEHLPTFICRLTESWGDPIKKDNGLAEADKHRMKDVGSIQPTEIIVPAAPDRKYHQWRLVIIFWLLAIALGAIQALDSSHATAMDPDGIAYLDIGDAYFKGDWNTALNGLWPPLYSWILGLALLVLKPSPRWEFFVVHLINFVIYLFTLGCFHFFLRELIRYHRNRTARLSGEGSVALPEWAWLALGYTLFLWSSLSLITVQEDSPDMLVAALVYLASGILLRIRMGFANWLTFALLGAVLGVGYLAKTFMVPVAFTFLGITIFSSSNLRRVVPRVLIALVFFLLVGSPFIAALSIAKGCLTFGDSADLNYSFHVNGIPFAHWQGEPPGNGTPKHPTRKIYDAPAIYEFGTPIGGTYPPWHDPSYWNEGAVPRFDLKGHIRVLESSALTYFNIFFLSGGSWIAGCLVLYLMGGRRWLCVKDIAEHWNLLVPAVAVLGALPLLHVEPSYIGSFVVLLWIGLFSGVRLPDSQDSKKLAVCVMVAMVTVMIMATSFPIVLQAGRTALDLIQGRYPWPYEQWQVAEGLHRMGVQSGDRVVFIGRAFGNSWARLARVRIVAEMPAAEEVKSFWAADSLVKSQVIKAFAGTGAVAIVTRNAPSSVSAEWQRIGNTSYYAYILSNRACAAGR